MKQDLAEMNTIAMRIMEMVKLAQLINMNGGTDNEARGALCGMLEALHDLDVIHSYISRRRP